MVNRIITSASRSSSPLLTDCLCSLFALELLAPSTRVYLTSPWISDIPLIENRHGQLRALMPEAGSTALSLADVLSVLDQRGAMVRVLYRPKQPGTEDFLRRLPPTVQRRSGFTLHVKGLVTDHAYLRGSMNFTYFGINLNEESVELTTDPHQVALAMAEADQLWERMKV